MFQTITTDFPGQPSLTRTVPASVTIRRKRNADGTKDVVLPDGSLYCRIRRAWAGEHVWQVFDLQFDRPDADVCGQGVREASIKAWITTGEDASQVDYRAYTESRDRAALKVWERYS